MARRPISLVQCRHSFGLCCTVVIVGSCTTQENYLGFDRVSVADVVTGAGIDAGPGFEVPTPSGGSAPVEGELGADGGAGGANSVPSEPSGSISVEAGPAAGISTSTMTSRDAATPSTGAMAPGEVPQLDPLVPRQDLPNHLSDVLGVNDEQIDARINSTFDQLFYGDPDTQAIYYEVSEDEAYIYDVLNNDTRIDALGYGLMITVQLDHQAEFDKIWNFTKNYFQVNDGPSAGYFRWTCSVNGQNCRMGPAAFGAFYVATALLFAEARWGNGQGVYDYGSEARFQLDVMRNKEQQNGGVVDGVTNLFDDVTFLPQQQPDEGYRQLANPGAVIPAFFEIWGAAEDEPFWTAAAAASRRLGVIVAHPQTGLASRLVTHDGEEAEEDPVFNESVYPYGFNMALDYTWFEAESGQVDVANRLATFFDGFPTQPYPGAYSTTGRAVIQTPSYSLIAINGATAAISTVPPRPSLIRDAWELPLAEGQIRFFDGVNRLLSFMLLSGRFRAYVTAE